MNDIERYNFWNLELNNEVKILPVRKEEKIDKSVESPSPKKTEFFHLDIQSHIH